MRETGEEAEEELGYRVGAGGDRKWAHHGRGRGGRGSSAQAILTRTGRARGMRLSNSTSDGRSHSLALHPAFLSARTAAPWCLRRRWKPWGREGQTGPRWGRSALLHPAQASPAQPGHTYTHAHSHAPPLLLRSPSLPPLPRSLPFPFPAALRPVSLFLCVSGIDWTGSCCPGTGRDGFLPSSSPLLLPPPPSASTHPLSPPLPSPLHPHRKRRPRLFRRNRRISPTHPPNPSTPPLHSLPTASQISSNALRPHYRPFAAAAASPNFSLRPFPTHPFPSLPLPFSVSLSFREERVLT